jgi:hypothetical protein
MRFRHGASVNNEFTMFNGLVNPALAAANARELGTQLGTCAVDRYSAPVPWIGIRHLCRGSVSRRRRCRSASRLRGPQGDLPCAADLVGVAEKDWPKLRVISIASLIAGAMQRFLANGSLRELY